MTAESDWEHAIRSPSWPTNIVDTSTPVHVASDGTLGSVAGLSVGLCFSIPVRDNEKRNDRDQIYPATRKPDDSKQKTDLHENVAL
ncbi:MAG: hypothetical protein ACR2NZ_17035 [Rubripirellula sp.]